MRDYAPKNYKQTTPPEHIAVYLIIMALVLLAPIVDQII